VSAWASLSRRRALAVLALSIAGALGACQKALQPEQFVGRWKSSRLGSTLLMSSQGEWELRDTSDRVLQYGVWQLRDRTLVWSVRLDGRLQHDPNAIVDLSPTMFQLRERDGSITRFDRLPAP
jgi:hypothetical protein